MTMSDNDLTQAAMSLDEVSFGYEPGMAVLHKISGVLPTGRICALIGPNAAGKSTLLRLMLGHLRPWTGHVVLRGTDVLRLPEKHRAALVSFVPQRGSIAFTFTVRQVVEMGRFALGPDPDATDMALKICDLEAVQQRVFGHLSVGQQQRVLLARAMAQSRGFGQVMLLDEPTSAMDLHHVYQCMDRLVQLARSGLAVLVVLHDLNLAARYADEVWLMDGGRLVAAGCWADVLCREILEPVYQVTLQTLTVENSTRPLFWAEPTGTLLS